MSQWAEERGEGFFMSPDESTLCSFAEVTAWVQGQHYEASAISTFLQRADYYLVSQAHAGKYTVVTHEVPAASPRKIKIPDVCVGMRIKCMSPFEMLRHERARFVLGRSEAGLPRDSAELA